MTQLPRARSLLPIVAVVLLGLALGAGAAGPKKNWPKDVKKAFKTIKVKECLDHVKVLASEEFEGRAAGTEGGRLAAEYVAQRFEEIGLEPAGTLGYFQPFQLVSKRRSEGPIDLTNKFSVEKKRGSRVQKETFEYGKDFVPEARSGEGALSGPLVFLGREGAPLPDVAVEGKVVVFLAGFAEQEESMKSQADDKDKNDDEKKEEEAEDDVPRPFDDLVARGAQGIVFVPESKDVWSFDEDSWPDGVKEESARIPVIRCSYQAASKLLKKAGTSPAKLLAKPTHPHDLAAATARGESSRKGYLFGLGRNIIGYWPGTDEKLRDETIVVGAHRDHVGKPTDRRLTRGRVGQIHNGADDNASGTSGLIELAEAFAVGKIKTKRTVIFISFDAEELGLVGSKYFVANPTLPRENMKAMLNMDMISRNEPREMYFGRDERFPGLNALVSGIAEGFGIFLNPEGMEKYMERSDQAPFIAAGIPAVFIYGGDHAQYHTENDDVELINPRKIEAIAQLMFLFAYECANFEESFK